MKTIQNIIFILCSSTALYSCDRSFYNSPNEGPIEIKIKVVAEKDGIVHTPSGTIIGTIDDKGTIFDMNGNKIGQRKPTSKDLMINYEKKQIPFD